MWSPQLEWLNYMLDYDALLSYPRHWKMPKGVEKPPKKRWNV